MKTLESVEKSLQKIIEKYKLEKKLSIKQIKDWVYNEDGDSAMDATNRYQSKWMKYFKNINLTNEILQVFVDAWNFSPHKSLGGKSPHQMTEKFNKASKNEPPQDKDQKPNFIVGGKKMSWDEYWAMIARMEELQIPFKKWINDDLFPKYIKYLEENFKGRTIDKHCEVANIFFNRVLHVGFLTLEQIRKDFIQKEFPRWWQTHVMWSSLKEKEIIFSLKILFEFIQNNYSKNIKNFGF